MAPIVLGVTSRKRFRYLVQVFHRSGLLTWVPYKNRFAISALLKKKRDALNQKLQQAGKPPMK